MYKEAFFPFVLLGKELEIPIPLTKELYAFLLSLACEGHSTERQFLPTVNNWPLFTHRVFMAVF